jgi:hypothetical protein
MYLLGLGVGGSLPGFLSTDLPTETATLRWVTITEVTLRWNLAGLFGVYIFRADRGLRAGLGWGSMAQILAKAGGRKAPIMEVAA